MFRESNETLSELGWVFIVTFRSSLKRVQWLPEAQFEEDDAEAVRYQCRFKRGPADTYE